MSSRFTNDSLEQQNSGEMINLLNHIYTLKYQREVEKILTKSHNKFKIVTQNFN